ncbi:antitermination protein [Pectobacterium aroidearum]|uniref:antitermination protein Q n=1 Tax=Pectobacterium aroidearum TaxID=1201031 RepID=UPI002FCA3F5A
MRIESALKYFSPKSQQITDTSRNTSSDALTGTDMMGAIGLCQSKAGFGVSALLGRAGISEEDKERAIAELTQYAKRTAPKLVTKAAGGRLGRCMVILAGLAFEEYSRSASTSSKCPHCKGKGLIRSSCEVVKYPGYVGTDGEEKIPQRTAIETVTEKCKHCNGKGVRLARCRCNGTGQIRDMDESKRQGAPVYKGCERCSGRGYRRQPGSAAYRAISALLPDLQERTWNRNWKPFFEKLVAKCGIEESRADIAFKKMIE